jgi:NTE family protein
MISPRLQDFGLFDFHRADDLVECGRQAAQRHIEDIVREVEARNAKRPGTNPAARNVVPVSGQPVAK